MEQLEILGIGSALVDIIIPVQESFLREEGLPLGGMTLVDAERSDALLRRFADRKFPVCPGGAAANVMAAFAHCGGRAGFIGKIGGDAYGRLFAEETGRSGVTFLELQSLPEKTGRVLSFITPDGQRTFATHLGAAVGMRREDLMAENLGLAPWLFVEAYLLFNRDLMQAIVEQARSRGQKIVLDLASYTVVEQNREYLLDLLQAGHVHVLFANEEESFALTRLPPHEALRRFSGECFASALKLGPRGSLVSGDGETYTLEAEPVKALDTNGAGDAYAGAMLFALRRGLPLAKAAAIGTRAGALMVGQPGARLTGENAMALKAFVDQLEVQDDSGRGIPR